MPEYDQGPARDVRRALADGAFPLVNDPEKAVHAMLDLIDLGGADG